MKAHLNRPLESGVSYHLFWIYSPLLLCLFCVLCLHPIPAPWIIYFPLHWFYREAHLYSFQPLPLVGGRGMQTAGSQGRSWLRGWVSVSDACTLSTQWSMCLSTWSPATPSSPFAKERRKLFIIVIFFRCLFLPWNWPVVNLFLTYCHYKGCCICQLQDSLLVHDSWGKGFQRVKHPLWPLNRERKKFLNIKESFHF